MVEEKYYEDSHGNKVYGNVKGLNISLCCCNATIYVKDEINIDNVKIIMSSNSYLEIGKGSILKSLIIKVLENGRALLGENNRVTNSSIKVNRGGYFESGTGCTYAENCKIDVGEEGKIILGNDVMFSWDISILSQDGHAIFDTRTKDRINTNRNIEIGNHVWIGMRAVILPNTVIGNGSVVGACSVVKGRFPNNCIVVGNPTTIIKRDVYWQRENIDNSCCPEEYIRLTELAAEEIG